LLEQYPSLAARYHGLECPVLKADPNAGKHQWREASEAQKGHAHGSPSASRHAQGHGGVAVVVHAHGGSAVELSTASPSHTSHSPSSAAEEAMSPRSYVLWHNAPGEPRG